MRVNRGDGDRYNARSMSNARSTPLVHQFANGMWLIAEPHAHAQSLAMALLTPAGLAQQGAAMQAPAPLLAEMIARGAGDLDARQHSEALDTLGVQRGTDTETQHTRVTATMLATRFDEALPLLADMVLRPRLDEASLPGAKELAIQAIDSLEDDPGEKVFTELRQVHFKQPYGRSPLGVREHIESMTDQTLRDFWRANCVPDGSILGVAGKFDWDHLRDRVEACFGEWKGQATPLIEATDPPRGYHHREAKTTQCHIGLAYDALPADHEDTLLQRTAAAVLSGGMSGRLFTEVREERGLCYAVYASYAATRGRGYILSYAGTTSERAQETLDVLSGELRRMSEGIDADEFRRAMTGMKSHLVMQGESTSARANAIATDQFVYGKPRTLDEITQQLDAITLERVNAFLAENPAGEMTLVTVGPQALEPSLMPAGA